MSALLRSIKVAFALEAADDPLVRVVEEILAEEPTIGNVHDIAESYVIGGHIRNRRAKLENFGWPRFITTVAGGGYRLCWQSQRPVEVTA